MAPQTVFLVGATGETGRVIAAALASNPDQFTVKALVRPASLEKPVVKSLRDKGVDFVQGDLITNTQADFEKLFAGQDIVLSSIGPMELTYDIKLADAAKAAGVKRFVPCAWMPIVPVGGHFFRDTKEQTYNHIKRIKLPYTIIDDAWWTQNAYPRLPSGRVDYAHSGLPSNFIGSGDVPTALIDLDRIGLYVARILADPRTLDKYVLAYDDVATQAQVWAAMERLSGESIPRDVVSEADLVAAVDEGRETIRRLVAEDRVNHENMGAMLAAIVGQYEHLRYVAGYNTPEYAQYLGYLTTKELYPDIEPVSYEAVLRNTIEGRGYKVYADRSWFKKP